MNHIYRLVWSTVTNGWIAVAETARGRSKGARRRLVAAALSVGSLTAQAGPTGGQVVAGSGSIAQSGATTTITQASPNLSLNWSTFNIAPQETVNFVQPSSTAIAVNRIFDTNGTQILGHLNANGQVFLINPNGILFGEGAQVNVGGLVASTLDWSGTATGNSISFGGSGSGSVVNRGTISAADGGYVALLGNHVENQGVISAQLGTVALGAGSVVTLAFDGRSLIHAQVDQNLLNSLAANGGLIRADGGQVVMTAGAKDALLTSVVNNSGTIEARTVNSQAGRIVLLGGMAAGTVNVGGTLDASAPKGGQGGFIETSAAHVKVGDSAKVTTLAANGKSGTWLIDPTDFTIAASGGDETGIALSAALNSGNVQILSSSGASGTQGNINVNAPVAWSANTLTLTAANDVNINAVMTVNNTAALDLEPGSGKVNVGMNAAGAFIGQVNFFQADGVTPRSGTGFLTIHGNAYTVVTSLGTATSSADGTLQGIGGDLTGFYALGSNIDASATASWSGGFTPIGNGSGGFSGVFDGLGHTISNLTISQPSSSYVGLFGYGSAATIRNVGLIGASIGGGSYVGGLVGYGLSSTVANSYVSGTLSGGPFTGGLVGLSASGTSISNSHATGSVNGAYNSGGLVGFSGAGTSISNSYATASVSGTDDVGGLTGDTSGTITNSYATGTVNGNKYTGGLVGFASASSINNSYATGSVNGTSYTGGLVGFASASSINNSYATGAVTGSGGVQAGGLVGKNYGSITNAYATGTVDGNDNSMGGLVGLNRGTIGNSFATGNVNSGNGMLTGGLVGSNGTGGSITNSYATGSVGGGNYVGGLAGQNSAGSISNSYATGSATAVNWVGGLIGQNISSGTVNNSYSSGSVIATNPSNSGTTFVGGLIGSSVSGASATNSFWDIATSGQSTSAGGTGMTTAQMQTQANFTSATAANGSANPAWDFAGTWVMYDGHTYPLLRSFMSNLVVTTNAATKTYDAIAYADAGGVSYSTTPNANLLGTNALTYTDGGQAIINAGTYTNALPGGLYSNQQGYIISYVPGTVTINKATLSVSGESAANKVYDTTNTATLKGGTLVGVMGSDAITLNQAGTFAGANVGNGIAVTAADTLSGAAAGNYTLVQPSGLAANITRASLAVTGISAGNKVYDTTTSATLSGTPSVTALGSDVVTVTGTGAGTFADQNVGNGKSVTVSGFSLTGAAAGNYSIVEPVGLTANITPASLTVSGQAVSNKVYDATNTATLSGGTLVGVLGGDTVTLSQAGTFASKNVGTAIAVTASDGLGGAAAGNYVLTQPSGLTANITPASLTVSGETAANKVYDATTAATLSGGTLVGVIGGDTVTLNQTGTFASRNVGTGIAVTASDSLGGAAAGNYVLTQPSGLAANITPAALTVSGETAANKVYDATNAATLSGGTLVGVLGGDAVTLNQAGTFASKNVGTGIAVTASDSLGGSAASNYLLTQPTGLAANITPASLTVSGETAASKVYDTTTTATLSGGMLVGVLGGDTVTLSQAGTFASKNVGTGIAVTASDSLGGAAAGNYMLTQPTGLTANITPASLTVSGETAANKIYDATNVATMSGGTLVGVLGGDTVTLNQAGTFATKNVGTGIAVTASDSLGGAAAGNYVLTQPSSLAANITPATLTVSGETAANKVYDATNAATLSGGALVGVLGGDAVTLNQAGAFATKNVGNGIIVTPTDSLGGTAASNYVLTQPSGLAANITPASLTVNGETAANKVYDTTTAATLSGGSLVGVLGGDNVTLTQAGNFASKNAGSAVGVTANDSLGGTDAGNYVLTQPYGLAANIAPASVTLNGLTVATKVYDGTTAATMTGTPTVVALGSDVLTISGSGSGAFADPNAGNNKPVAVSGYTLGGAAASNYTLTQVTGVTGNITPASLSVAGETAANKTYDSTTAATLNGGTLVGVIGSDAVTLNQTGVFASKNVGTGIAVTASDTLGGAAAGNYTLVQPTGLSANITAASLTVSGETAANKVYDGTTTATLASGKLVGVFSGDTVTLTESGAFASKNAGAGVAVTTSDSIGGTGASNYVLVQPTGVTGTITPAALTVSGETAANKVYDGTTAATLSDGTLLGVIGGDTVTLTQSGNFASKNVGTGVAITAADTLAGNAAGNYVLTQPTGLSASITSATLTYTASPVTLASGQQITGLTGSVSGFVPGDSLSGSTSGTLAWITTAAAGSAPGLYAIDGSGLTASNYVFTQAASNASALTLKAGAPSISVKNVVTAVYAALPSSQTSMQQAMQNTTPTIVVTKVLNNDGAIAELNGTPGPGQDGDDTGTEKIGAIDPVLRIVRSGIKLPDDALNLNE